MMLHATVNLRVGGMFHYRMSHPKGMEVWGRWVVEPSIDPTSSSSSAASRTPAAKLLLHRFRNSTTSRRRRGPPLRSLNTQAKAGEHSSPIEALPFNGTKVQRDFFTAFHGSMRQGWTGTMQQLSEFLGD
jgi:hypothetical protein